MGPTTHTIYIRESWLSDGSPVYRIQIKDHSKAESGPSFDAVDRASAFRTAEEMARLLNDVSNVLASVDVSDQTYA